jgi:hypothetical protein
LIRCTVERRDGDKWKGSGGNMLGGFVTSPFGKRVSENCSTRFLSELPAETRLVVLFGLGARLGYVDQAEWLIHHARPAKSWRRHNSVSYGDEQVTFVHTVHFASQGSLILDWLGSPNKHGCISDRARFGRMAAETVKWQIDEGNQKWKMRISERRFGVLSAEGERISREEQETRIEATQELALVNGTLNAKIPDNAVPVGWRRSRISPH